MSLTLQCTVRQEVWERWEDDGGVRSQIARETSPVHCHQLHFTRLHSGPQSLVSNRQGAQHQIGFRGMLSNVRQDLVADQGQEQGDRCHHRCRRKTFKTGHQAPTPSTCPAWKTLFDQTTGSTTLLPACNAIKGLLIGSTPITKYCLKDWLAFSGTYYWLCPNNFSTSRGVSEGQP